MIYLPTTPTHISITLIFARVLLFLCIVDSNVSANTEIFEPRSKWYTRYPHYPDYCSTEEEMNKRSIPPLTVPKDDMDMDIKTELLHVTAIIRHGARTPWNEHTCWSGWNEQKWDCELKTMTSPPAEPEILLLEREGVEGIEDAQMDGEGAMFLFEKNYDALDDPPQLRNMLNGTCQKGQLLLRGYVQELHNGRMLRDTYIKEKDTANADADADADVRTGSEIHENMVLFDLNIESDHRPYEEPSLYYRADDDQRTIMSGQVLLRGMFDDLLKEHSDELGAQLDPTIVVHTADREQDILSPNDVVCPRLLDLRDDALKSDAYIQRFEKSKESQDLRKMMVDHLGVDPTHGGTDVFQMEGQDCMMTAICNDHDLPDILNDCGKEDGARNFDRMNKFSFQPYNYVLRYNDGAYSKLAFGPMWVTILSKMLPFVPGETWNGIIPQMKDEVQNQNQNQAPKLAVFSAHDTTILPLLATLGQSVWDGEEWAPYASMIAIELHNVQLYTNEAKALFPSGKAFRLVYNGLVLTDKVDGCSDGEELCDIIVLLERVKSFAVKERDCGTTTKPDSNVDEIKNFLTIKGAVPTIVLTAIFFGALGGFATYFHLTRRLPHKYDGRGVFDQAESSAPCRSEIL